MSIIGRCVGVRIIDPMLYADILVTIPNAGGKIAVRSVSIQVTFVPFNILAINGPGFLAWQQSYRNRDIAAGKLVQNVLVISAPKVQVYRLYRNAKAAVQMP